MGGVGSGKYIRTWENSRAGGLSTVKEYRAWFAARGRCCEKNHPDYPRYGGRGIKMCKSWREDFRNFLEDMGACPRGLTLERINNEGNYEPENCKWATYSEQNKNRRKWFGIDKPTIEIIRKSPLSVSNWALGRKLGIDKKTVKRYRILFGLQ